MVACLGVLVLSGCGFHLRSYNLKSSVESFAITGKIRFAVVSSLRRALLQLDVDEVPADEASMVIDILDQRHERRTVSTSGQARAAEYQVNFSLQYRLLDASGEVLAAPIWIERQKTYQIDRGNIVGSSEEQALLQRELMQDVVSQLVRAMDLVSRPSVTNVTNVTNVKKAPGE